MNFTVNNKEELENFISHNWDTINEYIDDQQINIPIPIYASVDIRESSKKYAPIDHNIYPAGFNNLCKLDLDAATESFRKTLKKLFPSAKTVGIIPESHTKNKFYLDHLAALGKALRDAGYHIHFLGIDHKPFENDEIELNLISHSNYDILLEKAHIVDNQIKILGKSNTNFDFFILNNDQSDPLNVNWADIKTPVLPSAKIGWFNRKKHHHFKFYNQVADQFAEKFSIDPDLLQAKYRSVEELDFSSKQGLEKLAKEVDSLLNEIGKSGKAFVKASQGTYGMGISVVSSGEEILKMNRKTRNKMDIGKNKIKFTSAIVQEGVETIINHKGMPAEIAIYLVDGKSVGGFMRVNAKKSTNANLNSQGMVFQKFCISEIRQDQAQQSKEAVYSIIARLSNLASGLEIKEVEG